MPKGKINATVTGGSNLAITSKISDQEKEAGWQFVKFMTNSENAAAATVATGYLPTRASAKDSALLTEFLKQFPQMQIAFDQLGYAQAYTTVGNEESRTITTAIENIWISDADLTTTLQDAEAKINTLLQSAK